MNTQQIAIELRELVIKMLASAGSGHTAGAIDLADIYAVLYFSKILNLDPQNPNDPLRDRIIISNGHTCPILYATLAKRGYFPIDELDTLRQFGSRLQGHPHKDFSIQNNSPLLKGDRPIGERVTHPQNLPGIENTSGPLGQGVGFSVGLALGLRYQFELKKLSRLPRVICICGDGELDEGQVWEAFMSASKFKLQNLTFIIDRNDIQIDGFTHDVMPLEPLKDKLIAFGLLCLEINGHNHTTIYDALRITNYASDKPLAIIAHTTPGKGISFMEGKFEWHGQVPTREQANKALQELTC